MIKGCHKSIIFLKNTGSELFDEAYFVLSRDGEDLRLGEDDMVTEANRIINDKSYRGIKGGMLLRYKRQIISMTIGIMIGSLASFLLLYLT